MAREYLRQMLTPSVRAAQQTYYDRSYPDQGTHSIKEALGPNELAFLAERDSFYMATVTEDGWPYMQHRGGAKGFLVANTPNELLFADYGGNRQLISAGSVQQEPRVSLFLMDYANRTRLKIIGTCEVLDARKHPELAALAAPPGGHAAEPERVFRIHVHAEDWNCPKYITERYTRVEIAELMTPLQERIKELEAQVEQLT
jgi:predicted pyridoxine 5'-phosphate oxidase superfamily flavin-nucleotide-binding protein